MLNSMDIKEETKTIAYLMKCESRLNSLIGEFADYEHTRGIANSLFDLNEEILNTLKERAEYIGIEGAGQDLTHSELNAILELQDD
jgi:hypothetical protein